MKLVEFESIEGDAVLVPMHLIRRMHGVKGGGPCTITVEDGHAPHGLSYSVDNATWSVMRSAWMAWAETDS